MRLPLADPGTHRLSVLVDRIAHPCPVGAFCVLRVPECPKCPYPRLGLVTYRPAARLLV
jgi:hypothetical protein